MKELLHKLSSLPGVCLNPPVSLADMEAVESQLGNELPKEVKDFYLFSDGLVFHECLDIPSLNSAVTYFSDVPGPISSTLLVIVDEHESNPICMFHKGPLCGYVAHVFHDGDSHVRWRSFGALLEQISEHLIRDGDVNVEKLAGDLDGPGRTERDIEAGRGMVEFAKTVELHSADSPMAYGFAFDLLGDGQVVEIVPFLEHEDMFVARAARDRLAQLQGSEAKTVLKNYWDEVKRLKIHCAELFRHAGREVTVVNEDIRIGPGQMGLNWEAIYTERRRPDFDQWVVGIGRRTA